MRRIPKPNNRKNLKSILFLFFTSILAFILVHVVHSKRPEGLRGHMLQAARMMKAAVETVSDCRGERSVPTVSMWDINRTGLIGLQRSIITTTKGSLEAKRTVLDPNFAGLFVYLLHRAGVRRGDAVAAGVSSSFPGLILALLSAAKSLDLEVIMICSLGASQWGANDPDFHWLDMLDCLNEKDFFLVQPAAFSLGGEKDQGKDMDPRGKRLLTERLSRINTPVIREPGLPENVHQRMDLYLGIAGEKDIQAFINIGGSWANMGEDASILGLDPGLTKIENFPSEETQGVIHAMAARGVPVVHCLFIRGLARKYGIKWDPSPLPDPGEGELYSIVRNRQPFFLSVAAVYILCVLVVFFIKITRSKF